LFFILKRLRGVEIKFPESFSTDPLLAKSLKSHVNNVIFEQVMEKILKNISRSVVIDAACYESEQRRRIVEHAVNYLIDKVGLTR
jgi:hypothetical protein